MAALQRPSPDDSQGGEFLVDRLPTNTLAVSLVHVFLKRVNAQRIEDDLLADDPPEVPGVDEFGRQGVRLLGARRQRLGVDREDLAQCWGLPCFLHISGLWLTRQLPPRHDERGRVSVRRHHELAALQVLDCFLD